MRNRFCQTLKFLFIPLIVLLSWTVILSVNNDLPVRASAANPQAVNLENPARTRQTVSQNNLLDAQGDDKVDLEGWLLARPDDGIGEWYVQTEETITVTLIVSSETRLDSGVPPVGSWIKAEGIPDDDDTIQATRIRRDDFEADEIVVRLTPAGDVNALAAKYGLVISKTLLASARIYLLYDPTQSGGSDEILEQIKANNESSLIWAELNYVGSAPGGNPFKIWGWGGVDPTGYENQSAFSQINLSPTAQQYNGEGVTIAILDTGLAHKHPRFQGRWLAGYDVVAGDTLPEEEGPGFGLGHGTHIAGIVSKIAPNAKLLPVRVLDANGRGNTFTLAYAIEWAVQHNADVINLSLGTPFYSQVLQDAIAEAIAQGVVIVAATGNDNSNIIQYPAAFDDVISVAAVDRQNRKASFSNYGEWVDVAAPGLGITSTITGTLGLGYANWSGTSMATAFVSGAAALLKQKSPSLQPATLEELFISKGTNIDANNPQKVGRLLDVEETLAIPVNGSTATPTVTATATATAKAPTTTPTPTATLATNATATSTQVAQATATPTVTPTTTATATQTKQPPNVTLYLPLVTK